MVRIYRGYPQTLHITEEAPCPVSRQDTRPTGRGGMEPYMLYRREDQGGVQQGEPDRFRKLRMETDYFKALHPLSMKKRQVLVDEVCDRMEYDNSPMYDEYPDRVSLYRMRDRVCRHAMEAGLEEDKDLTQLLLLHEISRRRLMKNI